MKIFQSSRNKSFAGCLASVCITVLLQPLVAAPDDHKHHDHKHHDHHKDHDHASMAGPNGGKVLYEVHPHAELFVTRDRKLQITFLSETGKAVPPGQHTVKAICGKRTRPTRMQFNRRGYAFLSGQSLPTGKKIPTVVQIGKGSGKKPVIIRLNLDLETCPDCKKPKYACLPSEYKKSRATPGKQ